MSIAYEDIAMENAIAELYDGAKIERARKEQCIFLFVEGESEEIAFPILLNELIDLDELGIIVANYNGTGNLAHSLRLSSYTLSHDRPVIATYDNDIDGFTIISKIIIPKTKSELFHLFQIPQTGVIKYSNGHIGGSFEESFSSEDFINCAFSKNIIPAELLNKRKDFESAFNIKKSWLEQLEKYCAINGFKSIDVKKKVLAEELALSIKEVPETYIKLAQLIENMRSLYPVIHPDDVKLPKVKGLTD